MSYKLKQDSIEGFSRKVSGKICDAFYASNEHVDGTALMKLTNSKQANAFLVKALFERWQQEMENLQSPYFDFEHKQVKEALKVFMNVVSEHISISRTDIEPLLIKAIEETVLITFDPVVFVQKTLADSGTLSARYIKTRKDSFKKLSSLSGASAADFDEEFPVSPEDFVNEFGAQVDDLFEEESLSFFERLDASDEDDEPVIEEEAPEEEETIVEEAAIPEPNEPAPAPVTEPEPIVVSEELVEAQNPEATDEAETINDRFNGNGKVQTLADKLKKNSEQSLEASLNLNEKFMFINSLFEGDKDKLSAALSDLEGADDLEEAKMKAYKYSESWDMESEEVTSFFEVIERRFS